MQLRRKEELDSDKFLIECDNLINRTKQSANVALFVSKHLIASLIGLRIDCNSSTSRKNRLVTISLIVWFRYSDSLFTI